MLSSSRSHVFSRKGSTDRSRLSMEGYRGALMRSLLSSLRVGSLASEATAGEGSWWRKEVRRCEL